LPRPSTSSPKRICLSLALTTPHRPPLPPPPPTHTHSPFWALSTSDWLVPCLIPSLSTSDAQLPPMPRRCGACGWAGSLSTSDASLLPMPDLMSLVDVGRALRRVLKVGAALLRRRVARGRKKLVEEGSACCGGSKGMVVEVQPFSRIPNSPLQQLRRCRVQG
jgi:hypothetical protein